jgi:hypothetical protein
MLDQKIEEVEVVESSSDGKEDRFEDILVNRRKRVVENLGVEYRQNLRRVTQFIWLMFGTLEGLLGLRFVSQADRRQSGQPIRPGTLPCNGPVPMAVPRAGLYSNRQRFCVGDLHRHRHVRLRPGRLCAGESGVGHLHAHQRPYGHGLRKSSPVDRRNEHIGPRPLPLLPGIWGPVICMGSIGYNNSKIDSHWDDSTRSGNPRNAPYRLAASNSACS